MKLATIERTSRHMENHGTAYNFAVYLKKTSDQMLCYTWPLKIEDLQKDQVETDSRKYLNKI